MTAHDQLKANGITPTIDAEKAFQLGYAVAMNELMTEAVNEYKPANAGNAPSETAKRRYN